MEKNHSSYLASFKSLLTLLLIIASLSCGSRREGTAIKEPPPAIKIAQFDYSPPEYTRTDSTKVAVILIKPFYLSGRQRGLLSLPIFKDFSDKMGVDFEESMTARGFTIKGPFNSVDEVVYTDKKNSDLLLSIEIDISVNADNAKIYRNSKYHVGYPEGYYTYTYDFRGTIVPNGKINLVVQAVTKTGFGDKLSVKSIPVALKEIQIDAYKEYPDNEILKYFSQDPGMQNPLVEALNEYYTTIFNKAWNYLEPEEYKEFKRLADEIKGK